MTFLLRHLHKDKLNLKDIQQCLISYTSDLLRRNSKTKRKIIMLKC